MTIFITYDVNNKNTEIKEALIKKGYAETWIDNQGGSHQLPSTTLWKSNTTTKQGFVDMKDVADSLNISLEKAIAMEVNSWHGK